MNDLKKEECAKYLAWANDTNKILPIMASRLNRMEMKMIIDYILSLLIKIKIL